MHATKWLIMLAASAVALAALSGSLQEAAAPVKLRFLQLNIDYDDGPFPDSSWGAVDLSYVGHDEPLYFNLVVDGAWQVRNIPVLSPEGAGRRQRTRIHFDLQTPMGVDVRTLFYAFALTPEPLIEMPQGSAHARVHEEKVIISTGIQGGAVLTGLPNGPLMGGAVSGGKCTLEKFSNQECGNFECVPAAVSNSLSWLNQSRALGIPDEKISIKKMKEVLGFIPGVGTPENWDRLKEEYLKNENLPIKSRSVGRFEIDKVYEAVCARCDVELMAGSHAASVTGIAKLENGSYTLELTSDARQGEPGGTKPQDGGTEQVTYDPATGQLAGAPWLQGRFPEMIVIQCPEPTPSPSPSPSPSPTPSPSSSPSPSPSASPRPAGAPRRGSSGAIATLLLSSGIAWLIARRLAA